MSEFGFEDLNIDTEIERKDLSDQEIEKFQVIVECKDEKDLKETYEKLVEEGYECQVSTF